MKAHFMLKYIFIISSFLAISACSGNLFKKDPVLSSFQLNTKSNDELTSIALTDASSDELYGRLSPDGRLLVYASNQKGNLDIWIKDLTSGLKKRLTTHMAKDQMPSFSPNGEKIVFISMRDDVKGDIYIMNTDGGSKTKLTDRSQAESYPVFSSDSKTIYFVSGMENSSNISKLDMQTLEKEQIARSISTQPAASPDGKYLAYIKKTGNINRLYIMNLLTHQKTCLTEDIDFHCGFPTFSSDSQTLYFSIFYYVRNETNLTGNENATIFSIDLTDHTAADKTISKLRQLTSGKNTHLFLQAHSSGLLFTAKSDENLDIFMMSPKGEVPNFNNVQTQMAYALAVENPYDRLLALENIARFKDTEEYQKSLYLSANIYKDLAYFVKQRKQLEKLVKIDKAIGYWQGKAKVDLAVWEIESTLFLEAETGIKVSKQQLNVASNKLQAIKKDSLLEQHVLAYAHLKEGDILYLSGNDFKAVESYDTVVTNYPEESSLVIQAKLKLGEIYSQLRTLDLQIAHYISLFKQYPEEKYWLRIAIDHIIKEYKQFIQSELSANTSLSNVTEQQIKSLLIDHLRNLIDRNPSLSFLGAVIQYKMGIMYKETGQMELAVRAMKNVVSSYPEQKLESTKASFALGEYTLELSKELRKQKRYNEAGDFYSEAIGYYEYIMNSYPKPNKNYKLAKKRFISLGLLKAGQEESEQDIKAAKASYQRIIALAPEVIQAHRKTIELSVKDGSIDKLSANYNFNLKREPNNFIWHYCIGYIYLWKQHPTTKDFDSAEKHFEISRNLNSQNPFVYFSLGWIYEMRELYFGNYGEGLLEDAISSYNTAYTLNDRAANIQFDADCLLNLGNAFSHIGNTWNFAYEFYHQRLELNLPFVDTTREAIFLLNLGRAAFNLDKNDEASEHFEKALSYAIDLNLTELQAELIARLALNYQRQQSYEISTQYFQRSINLYSSVKNNEAIIPLKRSIALNYYYQNNKAQAIRTLDESLNLLLKYGQVNEDDFSRITTSPGMSLIPFGFDKTREHEVHFSLYNAILNDINQMKSGAQYLDAQLSSMDTWLSQNADDADITRAVSTIENRKAINSYRLSESNQSFAHFNKAYLHYEKIQSTELDPEVDFIKATPVEQRNHHLSEIDSSMMIVLEQDDFSTQLTNLNAASDIIISETSREHSVDPQNLTLTLNRYENSLIRLQAIQESLDEPFISLDIIHKAKNNFAILALYAFRFANMNTFKSNNAENAFMNFESYSKYLRIAVQNLKSVIQQTEPPEYEESSEDNAYSYNFLRQHLLSLINLSRVFNIFEDKNKKEQRSSQLLESAHELCSRFVVDDICFIVDMELALNSNDQEKIDKLVTSYSTTPVQTLDTSYLDSSDSYRINMFAPSIDNAIANKNYRNAWQLIELEKQKTVVDELSSLKLDADSPDIKKIIISIYELQGKLNASLKSQTLVLSEEYINNSKKIINDLKQQIVKKIEELGKLSDKIQHAFKIEFLDINDFKKVLHENQTIVSFYSYKSKLIIFSYDGKEVSTRIFPYSILDTNITGEKNTNTNNADKFILSIRKYLEDICKNKKVIYLDSYNLEQNISLDSVLGDKILASIVPIRFSSLAGLLQFEKNKNLYRNNGIITFDKKQPEASTLYNELRKLSNNNNFVFASYPDTHLNQVLPYFQSSSFIMLNQPLDFEGGSAANAWLKFNTDTQGFGHFALYQHLDSYFKTNLLLFSEINFTKNFHKENLLLEHLLGYYGLPGYTILKGTNEQLESSAKVITDFITTYYKNSRLAAYQDFMGKSFKNVPSLFSFYGYAGMSKSQTEQFVKNNIMTTLQIAIAFQKAKSHKTAVETYEYVLTMMELSKDYKFLDKVLEMLVSESRNMNDYEKAILYQHRVLKRAEEALLNDPKKYFSVLNAKKLLATYYAQVKLYDIALEYNQQIIDTLLKAKRRELTAQYYSQRGIITERAGLYEDAFNNYETAYNIFATKQDKPNQVKESINCARILRQRLSRYNLAKQYIKKALSLIDIKDKYEKLLLQLGLIRVELALGNFQKSIDLSRINIEQAVTESQEALNKAMLIFKDKTIDKQKKTALLTPLKSTKLKMDSIVLSSYVELVNALFRQGDYSEAFTMQKTAMDIAEKNNDIRKQIQLNNAKGLIYSFLGNTKMAIETFKWTLDKAKTIDDQTEQASAYNNLGDAYRKAGEFGTARKMFLQALEIDKKHKDTLGISYDYANLGLVFFNTQNYTTAKTYLNDALKISREINNPINEVKSLLALGKIALVDKNYNKAEKYFSSGLDICTKLNLADWKWKFYLQLGKLQIAQKQKEKSLDYLLAGIDAIEPLPSSIRIAKVGPQLEETKSELYDEALSSLAALGRTEEAFYMSERARARHFLDILGGKSFKFKQDNAAALLAKESTLKQKLSSAYDDYLKDKAKNKVQYEQVLAEYNKTISELSLINKRLPSFVTLDAKNYNDLKTWIDPDSAIISYYLTDKELIVFSLTSENLSMKTTSIKRSELVGKIDSYRNLLTGFHPVKNLAQDLYNLLLKSSESIWAAKEKLIIVPHNALHFLPFASLHDGERYLVESRGITVLNSANELRYTNSHTAKGTKALAMGGPNVNTSKSDIPLAFTTQELLSYSYNNKNATVLINENATESKFKELANTAGKIHLATHGYFDPVNPFESSLYLSKGNDSKEDGILKLHEIVTLNLNSELVTLSACNTAMGTIGEGDEIIGLSSAFLTAGAQQVVASLWRISDLSTAILMKHFFRNQQKHLSIAEALRQAQLKVIEIFPHPAYWSGFRLEGNNAGNITGNLN